MRVSLVIPSLITSIVLFLLAGCTTTMQEESDFPWLKYPESHREPSFTGHYEFICESLVYDDPDEVFGEIFAYLSRYKKNPYERETDYQARIAQNKLF